MVEFIWGFSPYNTWPKLHCFRTAINLKYPNLNATQPARSKFKPTKTFMEEDILRIKSTAMKSHQIKEPSKIAEFKIFVCEEC